MIFSENVDVFKSRWQHHCGSLVQFFEQWVEIISERAQIILIFLHPHFQASYFLRPELYEDLIIYKKFCVNMTAISEIV